MYDDEMVKFEFDAAPQVVRDEVAAEPLALLWLHAPLDMAWKHIESAFEQFVANPEQRIFYLRRASNCRRCRGCLSCLMMPLRA